MTTYRKEPQAKTLIKRTWMDTPLLQKDTTKAMKNDPLLNRKEKGYQTKRHEW